MKNKKISILLSSLSFGGAERVVSILLNEFYQKGIDATLVLMDKTIKYNIPEHQKVIYLDQNDLQRKTFVKFFKIPFLAWQYKKLCQDQDIAISLSFMNRSNYINVISSMLGSKAKIMISERTISSKAYATKSLKDTVSRFLIKTLYPLADKLIANSYGIQNDLIQNFQIDKKLIHVIYNPIDIDYIRIMSQNITHPIQKEKFTFITVGRLHKVKNHTFLIDIFKDIDANLIIVGEGEERALLEQKIQKHNLQNKITLVGKQTNPFQYLAQADCFLLSSKYEGFPNVILEAFACGLPVICTNCDGGAKEILSENSSLENTADVLFEKYGILVPLNNQRLYQEVVLQMMNDKQMYATYKDNIKNRFLEYDKDKISRSYLHCLDYNEDHLSATSNDFWKSYSKTERSINSLMNLESDEQKAEKKFQLEKEHLERIIALKPEDTLVDLGAGIGLWSEYFAKKIKHVYLVEKQEAFIEKAKFYHRENQNNNIEIIRNDIVDFTLENRVDYVFLSGVTIYLNDTAFNSLIEKIKSYLKPGGKIIHRDAYGRHERYVVNNYSEALKMNYSALYRTRDEYDEILVHKHHFKKIYDEDMYAGGENSPFNKWKETRLRLACYQNIKDMACK